MTVYKRITVLAALSTITLAASVSAQDYNYDPERTAILLVDPYNEFLSEGGDTLPAVERNPGCKQRH